MSKDTARELAYLLVGMPIVFAFIAGILCPHLSITVLLIASFGIMPFLVVGAFKSAIFTAVSHAILAAAFSMSMGASLSNGDILIAVTATLFTLGSGGMALLMVNARISGAIQ